MDNPEKEMRTPSLEKIDTPKPAAGYLHADTLLNNKQHRPRRDALAAGTKHRAAASDGFRGGTFT